MTLLKILSIIVAFLLFTSLWGFYISVRPPKIVSTITPKELGFVYEEVTFTTRDGLTLSGWFVPSSAKVSASKPIKTIILLHGYPADKGKHFASPFFLSEIQSLFI